MSGADVDAELIFMVRDLFEDLNITQNVRLEINSLGTSAERQAHREELVKWFTQHAAMLDEDSVKRLANPLRILDSKNPDLQNVIEHAPRLLDFLGEESRQHFDTLRTILIMQELPIKLTPAWYAA